MSFLLLSAVDGGFALGVVGATDFNTGSGGTGGGLNVALDPVDGRISSLFSFSLSWSLSLSLSGSAALLNPKLLYVRSLSLSRGSCDTDEPLGDLSRICTSPSRSRLRDIYEDDSAVSFLVRFGLDGVCLLKGGLLPEGPLGGERDLATANG